MKRLDTGMERWLTFLEFQGNKLRWQNLSASQKIKIHKSEVHSELGYEIELKRTDRAIEGFGIICTDH